MYIEEVCKYAYMQLCNTSNNCNNIVPAVLFLYYDTPRVGVALDKELQYIAQFSLGIIN